MSKLLFNLRNVPDDEAAEVRELFAVNSIQTYETRPSPFGVSSGAIWIKEVEHYEGAKKLLDAYQHERASRARGERDTMRREGRVPTLGSAIRAQPLAAALLFFAIAAALAISAWPYFWLTR